MWYIQNTIERKNGAPQAKKNHFLDFKYHLKRCFLSCFDLKIVKKFSLRRAPNYADMGYAAKIQIAANQGGGSADPIMKCVPPNPRV